MTPAEFKSIRESCGLSQSEWAVVLGYRLANPRQHIYAMENGRKPITEQVARLATMLARHGVPADFFSAKTKIQPCKW